MARKGFKRGRKIKLSLGKPILKVSDSQKVQQSFEEVIAFYAPALKKLSEN